MISVIIPTFNESSIIEPLLHSLSAARAEEVIVSDGGSTDDTVAKARRYATIVSGARGRAEQMNRAARLASGEVLLFLHADVRLEPLALQAVASAMRDPSIAGGNFEIAFDGDDTAASIFGWINRQRYRFGIFYGDSGIFVRRTVFEEFGGYREWPILEDYELARRLWRRGRVAFLPNKIHVSNRRWRKAGMWTTLWYWFWIQGLYIAGVPPRRLAAMYRDVR